MWWLAACTTPPAPPPPEPEAPRRVPNVVVVLWDTARADRMSVYGHPRPTTPNLEALAKEAAVFDRAISPGMWTVPAHGSLFTGLPADSHGARVRWLWLDDHHVTFAEHFADHGYATFAWSSNPYLSEQTNLLQGFETTRYAWRAEDAAACAAHTRGKMLPEDRSVEIAPGWTPVPGRQGWPEHLVLHKDCAPRAVDAFLAWQDGLPEDRPWLAYLNLLEAHHPRLPSKAARDAVIPEELRAGALATDGSLFRLMAAMEGKAAFTPAEDEALRAVYDATLRDLDDATGRLLAGLRERGVLDDTIVVVTADHGENLGEHGMYDHRWDLHQTLVHVPLLVRFPRAMDAVRVAEPVSTGHLYGTLLALTGLPAPDGAPNLPPLGAQEAVFTELEAPTPRIAEIRSAFPGLPPKRWDRRWREVVTPGPLALLRASDGFQGLYDLAADPGETTDLSATRPTELAELQALLTGWVQSRPAYDPRKRGPRDRPGNPLAADGALDPADAEQLRALGYATDDPAPAEPE